MKELVPPGRVATIALRGDLDISTRSQLRERFDAAAKRGRDVVVDLTEVTYMDSSAIGALIGLHRQLFEHNATLRLEMKRNPAYRLLEIAGLTGIFDIALR